MQLPHQEILVFRMMSMQVKSSGIIREGRWAPRSTPEENPNARVFREVLHMLPDLDGIGLRN